MNPVDSLLMMHCFVSVYHPFFVSRGGGHVCVAAGACMRRVGFRGLRGADE
jgi:hypothetical protein